MPETLLRLEPLDLRLELEALELRAQGGRLRFRLDLSELGGVRALDCAEVWLRHGAEGGRGRGCG